MGVDRGAASSVWDAAKALRIADLSVNDVLPAEHAVGFGRSRNIHPWHHFAHGAAIDDLGAISRFDLRPHGRNGGARLAGKEHGT